MDWSWEIALAGVAALGSLLAGVAAIIQIAHNSTALKRFERWVAVEAAYGAESHMGAIARRRRDEAMAQYLAWMKHRVIVIASLVCCTILTVLVGWFLAMSLIVHPEVAQDRTWMTVLICTTIAVVGLMIASAWAHTAALHTSRKQILPAIRSDEDLALDEQLASLDPTAG